MLKLTGQLPARRPIWKFIYLVRFVRQSRPGLQVNTWLSHHSQSRDSTRVKRGERAPDSEPVHCAATGSGSP